MKSLALLLPLLFSGCGDAPEPVPRAEPPIAPHVEGTRAPSQSEEALTDRKIELAIARKACELLHGKAEALKEQKGRYPASMDEIKDFSMLPPDVVASGEWIGNDPWGNAYVYEVKDGAVHVSSWGPDGKPGTEDDISYAGH